MAIVVKYINKSTKIFDKFEDIFDDNQLNIIYLDCSSNQLKELPVEIGRLINLQIFYCSSNQPSRLPIEIGHLINLRIFDCYGNRLSRLPIEIGRLINLRDFSCSDNQLKDLPIEIINCINLRYFYYSNNEIIMDPIIERFINRHQNINNHNLYNDRQNVHTSSVQQSIKESVINLLKDTY